MIGKIVSVEENYVMVNLSIDISSQTNLINVHVIFEDCKYQFDDSAYIYRW